MFCDSSDGLRTYLLLDLPEVSFDVHKYFSVRFVVWRFFHTASRDWASSRGEIYFKTAVISIDSVIKVPAYQRIHLGDETICYLG